ncbi:MAG: hypothetical protein GJ676_06735 [Rhodobacteraceae bacterium]|nr:hypothetical protein [Paracoccaceae bacterium]
METGGTVLVLGSAPHAVEARTWPRSRFSTLVVLNNAWRIREDWDFLVAPDDFPADRRPGLLRSGQRVIGSDTYVPANNVHGGIFYAGGTMAFSAAYWVLAALRPRTLGFFGCDMVYPSQGQTHFYGTGSADPLRQDKSLRNLEAKSARLMLHAARQGTACVRLGDGPSRLLFPQAEIEALDQVAPANPRAGGALFDALKAEEAKLNFHEPSGRYWKVDEAFSTQAIDALDRRWVQAVKARGTAGGTSAPVSFAAR